MVRAGLPRATAQLLRPGCARVARSLHGLESFLPARAGSDAVALGGDRHDRGGYRITGVDLGRLLVDATECAARLLAARHDRTHVALAGRADLYPRNQQHVD